MGGLFSIWGSYLAHRFERREEAKLIILRSLEGVRDLVHALKREKTKDNIDRLDAEARRLRHEGSIARGRARKLTGRLWVAFASYKLQTLAEGFDDDVPANEQTRKERERLDNFTSLTREVEEYLDRKATGFIGYRLREFREARIKRKESAQPK